MHLHRIGKASLAILATVVLGLAAVPVSAAYKVTVKKCNAPKGSVIVDNSNADAWSRVGVDDPRDFITSALIQSGCFTIAASKESANYRVNVGPLTEDEYNAGPENFSGQTIVSGGIPEQGDTSVSLPKLPRNLEEGLNALLAGKNKMDYAFVDILDRAGNVVTRGFGRGNATSLDYSHWSHDQSGVRRFNSSQKSRRAGGAMFNAFHEAKKPVLASNFGNDNAVLAKAGSSSKNDVSLKSSGTITMSELKEEQRKNAERFFNKYAATKGGRYVTLTGYVARSNARAGWVLLAANPRFPTTALSGVTCENVSGSNRILNLNKDDPITVRGTLTILTKEEEFLGTYGLGDPLSIRRCTIVSTP